MTRPVPQMPESFKGAYGIQTPYIKTLPRKWTPEEIAWIESLRLSGFSTSQICESIGRNPVSVSIKMKRIGKKDKSYNARHLSDKYETNALFFEAVAPRDVLDVFSGATSWYAGTKATVVTNDSNTAFKTDFNLDALRCLSLLYSQKKSFDLIDLDPFGSAYDCFDLALKMARCALIITYGEMGHARYKRLDFVRRYYDISDLTDFTIESLITHTQKIALRNKKELIPVFIKNWQNISRVYYVISPLKITDQWE